MPLSQFFRRLSGLPGQKSIAEGGDQYRKFVKSYVDAAIAGSADSFSVPKLEETELGKQALEAEPREQVLILHAAYQALCRVVGGGIWDSKRRLRDDALRQLSNRLLRKRLPYRSEDLSALLRATITTGHAFGLPMGGVFRAVELFVEENGLDGRLRRDLHAFRLVTVGSVYADVRKIRDRAKRILEGPVEGPAFEKSPWAKEITAWLKGLEAPVNEAWVDLLAHARSAADKPRPSGKWSKSAAIQVETIGPAAFAARLTEWLEGLELDPQHPEPNIDVVKGLIWAAAGLEDEALAFTLGRFSERCFRKVTYFGPRSPKLGNACLHTLSVMPAGTAGVAELARLMGKVRYASARTQIEKALGNAAERTGKTVEELEELAVPDFGLSTDGSRREALGDFEAEIRIAGTDTVTLAWTGTDGKVRKGVPAAIKRDHPEALKQIKQRIKEIKATLSGQSGRIERLFLAERTWPLEEWRKLYLDHPLLANLCRRLIWRFESAGKTATGIAKGDQIVDAQGASLDWLGEQTKVALWHPIVGAADEVLAWRRCLEAREITQPFKQAHREIYVLTDAERRTETYSNRFAAHIIRQHQFRALCQQRGWRYELQGAWDSHNVPERRLGRSDLTVAYWVEPAADLEDLEAGATGYAHLVTDQVRFTAPGGDAISLENVPPLVFSEAMRDVDLFVAVTSIGNDPNWVEGGEGHHAVYWREYSFGGLSETAKTRRDVLERLIPKLKIAQSCSFTERYLVVRGQKRTYKIHLGSGNILMEPNDQYLCIVRDAAAWRGDKLYLPFEGDGTLSLILSKAFMLAKDDKIDDKTILAQIRS